MKIRRKWQELFSTKFAKRAFFWTTFSDISSHAFSDDFMAKTSFCKSYTIKFQNSTFNGIFQIRIC